MRLPVASAALAAAFVLTPVAIGFAPAFSQDFSITNQEPADGSLRDVMRQLQAWWDVHAYYPRHASANDEGGTVKVHLKIQPDGVIRSVDLVGSSGSASLDAAGAAVFHEGFVRPLPDGAPGVEINLSLHYVLAHRHDQPVPAGYVPVASRSAFTIANDPVKSPILETMLQKSCTGTLVKWGIRNHPIYGVRYWIEAIFFRTPDGKPWVKFYEGGYSILAPVIEVGKMVKWTGSPERGGQGFSAFTQFTVWPDGDNKLSGNVDIDVSNNPLYDNPNHTGTVDFTCAPEVVAAPEWRAWFVTAGIPPPGDPP